MEAGPFYQWEERARGLGRAGFLAAQVAPVLVVYDPLPELGDGDAHVETGKFAAVRAQRPTPLQPASGSLVLGLQKSQKIGNLFPTMITVGRARNNDLVLPSSEISSFHAYFVPPPSGPPPHTWAVCDAESSNGTTVNGQPAPTPTAVASGDEVCFARVRCRFFQPAQLWDLLQGALPSAPPSA